MMVALYGCEVVAESITRMWSKSSPSGLSLRLRECERGELELCLKVYERG